MTTKITKLTEEQKARMPEWRDMWIQIGLCTDPADRPLAEKSIRECYEASKLAVPETVVWVDSPLSGALVATYSALAIALKDQPEAKSDRKPRKLNGTVRENIERVVQSVTGVKGKDLDKLVNDALREEYFWHDWLGGQFWAGWPAQTTFFREVCGLDLGEHINKCLEAYANLSRSCAGIWPNRDFIVLCERPKLIARDNGGRLHRADGPAFECRDGWGVYMWHGVEVPSEWITNKASLTPEIALTWANAEQRRAAAEIIGWPKIMSAVNARVIDQDEDPMIGTLLECDLPGSPKSKFLQVKCGTLRDFVLPVPTEMQTALEAQAWMFPSLTKEDIRNYLVRT